MAELFLPPRIVPVAARSGFEEGLSLDEETGWAVNRNSDCEAMWKHIIEDGPYVAHMCPPCRKRSVTQQYNPLGRRVDLGKHIEDVRWSVNLVHIVAEVAIYQIERGRNFIYATPSRCASLKVPVVKELLQMKGVYVGVASGCESGLRCPDA